MSCVSENTSSSPQTPSVCWKGWKHPCHFDTWESLALARCTYPHVRRFKRVLLDMRLKRHSSGDAYCPALDSRTGSEL